MSGIVGIWNRNGELVDAGLLGRLTAFMDFRGPDARQTWTGGQVGFGHTMLRTTWEAERESQPCSLDGDVWIVADARIDARTDLLRELAAAGRKCDGQATDPELILHAYHAWGQDCVQHLLGDFAFAIWDGQDRRLFCARDQFGVKPFYYAEAGGSLVLSNTLHCLRQHPGVSSDLNDLAIADFLYYGLNQDLSTTSFAAIRRLPPAHTLVASEEGIRTARYWTLPVDGPIRYRKETEYVDHFRELLRTVVADRLRTNRVGIYMSGGLDSPGLAATARALLEERGGDWDLRAYTVVYDRLIPDEERHYAGLVASALRIPIDFAVADDCEPFARAEEPKTNFPEPLAGYDSVLVAEQMTRIASRSRVLFHGEGPDNALKHDWPAHIRELLRRQRSGTVVADLARYVLWNRRVPFVSNLPDRIRRWLAPPAHFGRCALRSMNPELVARAVEAGDWERRMPGAITNHPLRPWGYRSFSYPEWQRRFETTDAGATYLPLEWRHPYLDVRMIRYLLAVPWVSCGCNKRLLRKAFRGVLPGPVLGRPKSPLAADPLWAWLMSGRVRQFTLDPDLARYVTVGNRLELGGGTKDELYFHLRVVGLSFFLKHARVTKQNSLHETTSGQIGCS